MITIPSAKYTWLSPSSPHSFIIDDVMWPTITHYLTAKRFEGTLFEDTLRCCKSISALELLTKPRLALIENDGVITRTQVYGTHGERSEPRSDWREVRSKYVEIATRAKFSQNPGIAKKLKDTSGMGIISPFDPTHATAIKKIREEMAAAAPVKKKNRLHPGTSPGLVDVILKNLKVVARVEGCAPGDYHIEMFEDLIYSLFGDSALGEITDIASDIFKEWANVSPQTEEYVLAAREKIRLVASEWNPNDIFKAACTCTAMVMYDPTKIKVMSSASIRLLPTPRAYRSPVVYYVPPTPKVVKRIELEDW